MDNTAQKNIIYQNDSLNKLPYSSQDCLKIGQNQNINDIKINNIFKQLVNNDLYTENLVNQQGYYQIGPKDKDSIELGYDGYKCYDDEGQTDLSILHRVDKDIQSTITEETEFCSEQTFVGSEIFGIFTNGDYTIVLSENGIFYRKGDECYDQCMLYDQTTSITANCFYSDDNVTFLGGVHGVYQMIFSEDEQQQQIVYAVKISDSSVDGVTSIHYQSESGRIIAGTSSGKIVYGYFNGDGNAIDFYALGDFCDEQYGSSSSTQTFVNPGKVKSIIGIEYDKYTDNTNSIVVGTENGLFRNIQTSQIEGYQEKTISKISGCSTAITGVFSLHDSIHFISTDGIYCISEDVNSATRKCDIKNLENFSENGDSVLFWVDGNLYEYLYDKTIADFKCVKLLTLASLKYANVITIGGNVLLLVSAGKSLDVYDYAAKTWIQSLHECNDDILNIQLSQNSNRVFFITKNKLFRIDIIGLTEKTIEKIDNLQKKYDGQFKSMVVCDDTDGNRIGLFASDGVKIHWIRSQIQEELPIENSDDIVDFDVAYVKGSNSSTVQVMFMTSSGIYSYDLYERTKRTILEFSDTQNPLNIIHSGNFSAAQVDDTTYTIDMYNGMTVTSCQCGNIQELHNYETDNNKIYGLSSQQILQLEIEKQIDMVQTETNPGIRLFKTTDGNTRIYATDGNGLSTYVLEDVEGADDYQICSVLSLGKQTTYVENITDGKYINCSKDGVVIRDISNDTLLSTIFEVSSDGAYMWNDDNSYGCYSLERKLCCIGESVSYRTIHTSQSSNANNMFMLSIDNDQLSIDDDPRFNQYITTDSATRVTITNGTQTKSCDVNGDVVGMGFEDDGIFVVTTQSNMYIGNQIVDNFLTCTGVAGSEIRYYAPFHGYDKIWNLMAVGNSILYIDSISQQTTIADFQELFSVSPSSGDGGIRSFSLYSKYIDEKTVKFYVSINTDLSVFLREITQPSEGVLQLTNTSIYDDKQIGSYGETSVVNTYFNIQDDSTDSYFSMKKSDGETYVLKNEKLFDTIEGKYKTYKVLSQSIVNFYGQSLNSFILDNNSVCQNDKIYTTDGKTIVTMYHVGQTAYIATTDCVVTATTNQNARYQLEKITLNGEICSITDVGNVLRVNVNGNNYLVACINGYTYSTKITDSMESLSESTNMLSICGYSQQTSEMMYNGQYIYAISTPHDGKKDVKKIYLEEGGDNLSAIVVEEYTVDAKYSLATVFDVSYLVQDAISEELFTHEEKLYTVKKSSVFNVKDVAYSATKVVCAAWSNDQTSDMAIRCYFLDNNFELFWLNEDYTKNPVRNFKTEFDIEPTSVRISNGTIFAKCGEQQYYLKNGNLQSFSSEYPDICGVEVLDGTYYYVFGTSKDGLYINIPYDCKIVETDDLVSYENASCSEFASILNNRNNNECVVIGKNNGKTMSLRLDMVKGSLDVQTIGDKNEWDGMWITDNTTQSERRFLSDSSYAGLKFYGGGTVYDVPRFNEDSNKDKIVGILWYDDSYFIFLPYKLLRFDGWTNNGNVFRRIGESDNNINQIFQINSNRFMTASQDGQYYFQYRNGTITIPVKINSITNVIRQLSKAEYDGNVWYVKVEDDGVYKSENCLSWMKILQTPNDHRCAIFLDYNRYLIGTTGGVYATDVEYYVKNDFYKFKESDIYELYRGLLPTISSKYDDVYYGHLVDNEYGHGPDSIIERIQDQVSGLMDIEFNNFGNGKSTWQTESTKTVGDTTIRTVTNDMVREVVFGNQDNGDITVDSSNFLLSSNGQEFTYIRKRWMSGLTELYIYIPTTNTYYINHIYGTPNCSQYENEMTRKNIQRFGVAKSKICGNMSQYYTTFEVKLDNVEYTVTNLLGVQSNGNSLPLKIYKDSDYESIEGPAASMFHSFVEPTINTSNTIANHSTVETEHTFKFACFGTDTQVVKLTFYDADSKNGGTTFKLVFNSNGAATSTMKQIIPMDSTRYVVLKKNTFQWTQNQKEFLGWSFTPNPEDDSTPDLYDRQQFSYTCKPDGYIPKNIYDGIKSGSTVNLYAVWSTAMGGDPSEYTTLTLQSNGQQFYIDSVIIDTNTSLGDKVIINYDA